MTELAEAPLVLGWYRDLYGERVYGWHKRQVSEVAVRGPVHVVDAGRYFAVVRDGVPMIERADTAGAVLDIEDPELPAPGTGANQISKEQ